MFLSRLNDIVEPRGYIQKDLRIFKEFKVSYQKIEVLILIADLLLIAFSSTFGGTVYRYLWHDNFATAGICLSVGLINGFFQHLCYQHARPVLPSRTAHVAYPVDLGSPRYSMSSDLSDRVKSLGRTSYGQGTLAFRIPESIS